MSFFPKLTTITEKILSNDWPQLPYRNKIPTYIEDTLGKALTDGASYLGISNYSDFWVYDVTVSGDGNRLAYIVRRNDYSYGTIYYQLFSIDSQGQYVHNYSTFANFNVQNPYYQTIDVYTASNQHSSIALNYDGSLLMYGCPEFENAAGYTDEGSLKPKLIDSNGFPSSVSFTQNDNFNGARRGSGLKYIKDFLLSWGRTKWDPAYVSHTPPVIYSWRSISTGIDYFYPTSFSPWWNSLASTNSQLLRSCDFGIFSSTEDIEAAKTAVIATTFTQLTNYIEYILVAGYPFQKNYLMDSTATNTYAADQFECNGVKKGDILVWYTAPGTFTGGNREPTTLINEDTYPVLSNFFIGDNLALSQNGKILFFTVIPVEGTAPRDYSNTKIAVVTYNENNQNFDIPTDINDLYLIDMPAVTTVEAGTTLTNTYFGEIIKTNEDGSILVVTDNFGQPNGLTVSGPASTAGGNIHIFLKSPIESEIKYALIKSIKVDSTLYFRSIAINDANNEIIYFENGGDSSQPVKFKKIEL